MKRAYKKVDFPVSNVRRFLEPGPVILVSSKYKDETDIMTMGWHMVLEFTPSLVGFLLSSGNHSHELVRKSKECVINIPTADMLNTVIGIGTTTGGDVDKFEKFGLTPLPAEKVKAPLIKECYANFECKVVDTKLPKYDLFILEVVKAHVAVSPKFPETVHYRGDGIFMYSGKNVTVKNKNLG